MAAINSSAVKMEKFFLFFAVSHFRSIDNHTGPIPILFKVIRFHAETVSSSELFIVHKIQNMARSLNIQKDLLGTVQLHTPWNKSYSYRKELLKTEVSEPAVCFTENRTRHFFLNIR